jgi:hypothetical protein
MLLSNLSHPDCNDTLIRLSRHGHPALVSASMELLLALFQERSLLCARMRDVKVRVAPWPLGPRWGTSGLRQWAVLAGHTANVNRWAASVVEAGNTLRM